MKHVEYILREVTLGPQHRETGFTRHYNFGVLQKMPAKLQIASFEGDSGFYLYYLNDNGECQSDTYHETLDHAQQQGKAEFQVSPDEWTVVNIVRTWETTPEHDERVARIRKQLSEGAANYEPEQQD